jgi:hypothetical protein
VAGSAAAGASLAGSRTAGRLLEWSRRCCLVIIPGLLHLAGLLLAALSVGCRSQQVILLSAGTPSSSADSQASDQQIATSTAYIAITAYITVTAYAKTTTA